MGMRIFNIFDSEGKYLRRTYRWNDIENGQIFSIRRNYHEVSESGWAEPETQQKAEIWCKENNIDHDLITFVATPEGKTRFIKGVDDHVLQTSIPSSDLTGMLTFHASLKEEYDIAPLLHKAGINQTTRDMHGSDFKKGVKVLEKLIK